VALAREENQDLIPPLPDPSVLPRDWDTVILSDDYSRGLQGWHTHKNGFPPSLSDHGFNGSPWAMKLATGTGFSTDFGGSNSIYKRAGHTFKTGFVLHGAWLAFRGPSEHASPGSFSLAMDSQTTDDVGRSFSRMRLRRFNDANAFAPQWALTPDQIPVAPPANTFEPIPGASVSQWPPVRGAGGGVPGWNVAHGNYFFAGLLVKYDLDDRPAGVGLGRYWRAYLFGEVYDISTLPTNCDRTLPGSGAENPGVDVSAGAPNSQSSFSGSVNFGYAIANGPGGEGPAELLVGHTFAVHYPAKTEFPTGA
jgi:hypothetical protein